MKRAKDCSFVSLLSLSERYAANDETLTTGRAKNRDGNNGIRGVIAAPLYRPSEREYSPYDDEEKK